MKKKIKKTAQLVLKNKKLVTGLGLVLASVFGFLLAFFIFTGKFKAIKIKKGAVLLPRLPKKGKIAGYSQTDFYDFDGDKKDEAVVIYHDGGDEVGIYRAYFSIFKLEGDSWESLVEQELEGFTLRDEQVLAEKVGKMMSQFELVDLTGDKKKEVLVKTRAEGSGGFFGAFVYGFVNGKGEFLWQQPPTPKGEVGIEKEKIFFLSPIYEEGDANCCPSFWVKSWWVWQDGSFTELGKFKGTDFEEVKARKKLEEKSSLKKLDSKWVHPADEAHEGVFEMWDDGTFTFQGFKSADFVSGGNWRFDRNVIELEFAQDLDYWREMFAGAKKLASYYNDVGEIEVEGKPSAVFDVFACEKRTGRACINLFNWLFYKEKTSSVSTSESKSDEDGVWEAVYDYAPRIDMMSPSVDFKLDKIVGNYALVQVMPVGVEAEEAALILEKVAGRWVVQDFGTIFPEWEEKVPALFKW